MMVWPSASLAGRPRRPWLFSVTAIPVLDSILILELRYHEVSEMCKPGGRVTPSMQRRALLKLAALSAIGLARAQATAKPNSSPSIHNTEPPPRDESITVGGTCAGLPGALQPGRPRRKVTVLDTGLPRNRFAGHSHGLLGHDHKPPLDILAEARQQLARYPTIRLVNARADSISGAIDDFSVLTDEGESLAARRLIMSYGVADQMPDIPGFDEGWEIGRAHV